jgi:(p)ppGpp synthase/HD superfamily hydrolase
MKMELVKKATQFSMDAHNGQFRKESGLPYIVHPALVAWLVFGFKRSKNLDALIAAALLHDTIEDCEVSADTIDSEFGPLVSSLVVELTNDKTVTGTEEKYAHMTAKILTMSSYALTIKLCDFLANLSDCGESAFGVQFRKKIRVFVTILEKNRLLTPTQKKILVEIQ